MLVAFVDAKATHISSAKTLCAIFNDQRFNDTLTNNLIRFEQLGPAVQNLTKLLTKVMLKFLF